MAPPAPRILIVEDESLVARDIQATLGSLGFGQPQIARDFTAALSAIAASAPDLILMDIDLGEGEDGIALAERLAAGGSQIPVVFLTGYFDDHTIRRARRSNPYGYLSKPFEPRDLRAAIELALSRHRSERAIKDRLASLGNTLNSIADGVIATDLAGSITYLNPAAEALTGWERHEAIGRALDSVFKIILPSGRAADPIPSPADSAPEAAGRPADRKAAGRAILLTAKDGTLLAIEDNSAPLLDPEGALTGLVIVFRQRPDHERPSDADASWSHLVGIVEGIDDPLFSVDSEWRFTYANGRAEAYFQRERAELVGTDLWSALPPAIHSRYSGEFHRALLHKEARSFELQDERGHHWFEIHAYPFGTGLLAFFRDVTERKHAEEQRAKLEKLEALGLLARGFAHDFNNLLTVLIGNLSLARSRIQDTAALGEIANAQTASQQAQSLVHQLLTFAKGGAPIRRPTDLGSLVAEVLTAHPQRRDLTYNTEIASGLPPADIDPHQVSRVVTNLLRNAEEATGAGGTVTVSLRRSPDDDSLSLAVADTGRGISEGDLPLVFEPFFSTRSDANASGIGLTVCESIAKQHGGEISVASKEGSGTTVTVTLPVAAPRTNNPSPYPPPGGPGPPPKRKRILLLEDEPLIRQLAVTNLLSHGYDVETTADGAETVERYRSAMNNGGGSFDILILDLTIPGGMGGARAMEQIKALDPGARAIVSSGYSDDPAMAHPAEYGFAAVLPKPYDPNDLTRLVAEVLA